MRRVARTQQVAQHHVALPHLARLLSETRDVAPVGNRDREPFTLGVVDPPEPCSESDFDRKCRSKSLFHRKNDSNFLDRWIEIRSFS